MESSDSSLTGLGRYLTPFSQGSVESPRQGLLSSPTDSTEIGLSVMEVVNEVERMLKLHRRDPRFCSAKREWRDLILLMNECAGMILSLAESEDPPRNDQSYTIDVEVHRLMTLSKIANSFADDCSPLSATENNASSTRASDTIDAIAKGAHFYAMYCEAVDQKADVILSVLEKRVEKALNTFDNDPVPILGHESIEFALSSSPEELQAFKKSNTMRWLNDVLKWQVIDMNIQLGRVGRSESLRNQIEVKKKIIKQMLRLRVEQSGSLMKLDAANKSLETTIKTLTLVSSPRQMAQSTVVLES